MEKRGQAVVVGASVAGLLAARALADHFAKVMIVDRDRVSDCAGNRRGVPQGPHTHGLLIRGEQVLSKFFPGFLDEAREAGASLIDMSAEFDWNQFGHWRKRFNGGFVIVGITRPLLESIVRRRVLALPNVELREQSSVEGLLLSEDKSRVRGVEIEVRHGHSADDEAAESDGRGARETVETELVVEAGGRGSRLPKWLQKAGLEPPEESVIQIGLHYSTRLFRLKEPRPRWKGVIITPAPPGRRGGIALSVENGLMSVTLNGFDGEKTPRDDDGFIEFTRDFTVDTIYQAVRSAEPVTEIASYHIPSNLRRHYERLENLPAGVVPIGDAICSFNPVYAQGMTVAAIEAEALHQTLERRRGVSLEGAEREYLKAAAKAVDGAWGTVSVEDLRYLALREAVPAPVRFAHWYGKRIHQAAAVDAEVARAFIRVMNMTTGGGILFRPDIAARVLLSPLRSRRPEPGTAESAAATN